MENEKLNCPNCGAPIDEKAFKSKNCPYCGGSLPQLNSEVTKDKKNIKFDKIVRFEASEENAKQKLVREIVFGYNRALLVANPEIIARKVYIPVWFFEGEFSAPWSCIKDEYIPIPMNGQAAGSFGISTKALSDKPEPYVNKYEMEDFLQSKIDKKAIVYNVDIEKDNTFIKGKIENTAEIAVEKQLPEKYRDLSWSFTYSNLKCFCVLVACWEFTYEYNGKKYVSYASGKSGYPFSTEIPRPSDAEIDFKAEHLNTESLKINIKPRINLTFFGWSCFSLLLFALGLGFYGLCISRPVILWSSVIIAIPSCVFGIRMNFKQQEEDDLISDIKHTESEIQSRISKNKSISKENERLQNILSLNSPMIEPYRAELEKRLLKTVDTRNSELTRQVSLYHQKLSADKRSRFYYGVLLVIAIFIGLLPGVNAITDMKNQIAEYHQQEEDRLKQEKQEEERLKNEVEQKRNEQKQRGKAVLDFISPNNLLTIDNNGCYQLRDDFAQALQKAGFEKIETGSHIDNTISYIFYVDDISDDGNISKHDYLTVDINDIQYEAFNDICERSQCITFKGKFDLDFLNRLVHQLKQQKFEVRKRDSDYPDFLCTKEKSLDNEIDKNTYMKNKVSIVLSNYEIKFVISHGPHIKIKDS